MSDPEVSAFSRVIKLRNGGGGQRQVIGGSIREPKAILRNYQLELDLKETKRRIDEDKRVRMRNMNRRNISLRTEMLERNARFYDQGQTHVCEHVHNFSKMKLLLRNEDALAHGYRGKATTPWCTHQPNNYRLVDNKFADVRPRAFTLESYLRQQKVQKKSKRKRRLAPNQMQPVESCPEISAEGVALPGIRKHRSRFNKKGLVDSDSIERALDSALSGRSGSLDSLKRRGSPESEPEAEAQDLPPRRLSRLRSITIGQTKDIQGIQERQRLHAAGEKLRRRSDVEMPILDDLAQRDSNRPGTDVGTGRHRRRSFESLASANMMYDSTMAEAERLLKLCHLKPSDLRKEHFNFDSEVSKINSAVVDE